MILEIVLLVSWLLPGPPLAASAEEIADLIKKLENGPKPARLEALQRFGDLKGPETLKAMPAIGRLLEDTDGQIREAAVSVLGTIAYRNKQPCPLAIVKALFDEEAEVRATAGTYVGIDFHKYPDEARALLLRALQHDDVTVRANSVYVLGRAWGKEKEIVAALKKATRDKNLLVRHNAFIALWSLTQDLDSVLPHWLQTSFEIANRTPGDKPITEEAKRERATAELIGLACSIKLYESTAERPAQHARACLKLLSDPVPVIRRAAVRELGLMAVHGKETTDAKDKPPDNGDFKLPPIDRRKVKAVLKELNVEAAVRKLLKDPDEGVRASAALALERLTKN